MIAIPYLCCQTPSISWPQHGGICPGRLRPPNGIGLTDEITARAFKVVLLSWQSSRNGGESSWISDEFCLTFRTSRIIRSCDSHLQYAPRIPSVWETHPLQVHPSLLVQGKDSRLIGIGRCSVTMLNCLDLGNKVRETCH